MPLNAIWTNGTCRNSSKILENFLHCKWHNTKKLWWMSWKGKINIRSTNRLLEILDQWREWWKKRLIRIVQNATTVTVHLMIMYRQPLMRVTFIFFEEYDYAASLRVSQDALEMVAGVIDRFPLLWNHEQNSLLITEKWPFRGHFLFSVSSLKLEI